MTAPIGEPPSMSEFIRDAESLMSNLNLERTETDRDDIHVLEGKKNENHIRVEFEKPEKQKRQRRGARDTIEEEIWNNISYQIIINGDLIEEKTYSFNFKFNSNLTWEEQISRFLFSIWGSIKGEIHESSN